MSADTTEAITTEEPIAESIAEQESLTEEAIETEFPVSLDNVFEILKNQRRRHVLQYLNAQGGQVSLRSLSEYVAAKENGKEVGQLSSQERKRVYVGLYQCHLPKMDDMGFIEFDKNRGTIKLGYAAQFADKYLEADGTQERRWPTYYLGLVGVGWLLLLVSLATSLITAGVAAGVFLTLLTGCALYHTYTTHEEGEGPSFSNTT